MNARQSQSPESVVRDILRNTRRKFTSEVEDDLTSDTTAGGTLCANISETRSEGSFQGGWRMF